MYTCVYVDIWRAPRTHRLSTGCLPLPPCCLPLLLPHLVARHLLVFFRYRSWGTRITLPDFTIACPTKTGGISPDLTIAFD